MNSTTSVFRGAKDNLKKASKFLLSQFDDVKHLIPVYKVLIRYPDSKNKIETEIIGDTSEHEATTLLRAAKAGRMSGLSPVVGIWVDKTSIPTDPDKAQLIIHNMVSESSASLWHTADSMAVRNWIDIWMGYKVPAAGAAGAAKVVSRLGLVEGNIWPAPFYNTTKREHAYGNAAHVFSGPIVRIDREVSMGGGDRLRITAWSAEELLQDIVANAAFWNINQGTFQVSGQTIAEHLDNVMTSVQPIPDDLFGITENQSFLDAYTPFLMGQFYYNLFDPEWGDYVQDGPDRGKGTPLYKEDLKTVKLNWPQNLGKKYNTLWSYIQAVINSGRHGLELLGARVVSDTSGKMRLQIFRKWHLDDMVRLYENFKKKVPRVALGRDMIDISTGIEYGNVFNSYDYIPRAPAINITVPNLSYNFPLGAYPWGAVPPDAQGKLFEIGTVYKDLDDTAKNLVKGILDDIRTYGIRKMPGIYRITKPAEGDEQTPLSGTEMINLIRRFYFGGQMGECLVIGDPSYQPDMPLIVGDDRSKGFLSGIALQKIKEGIGKLFGVDRPRASHFLKLGDWEEHYFFLWKVRHYIGTDTGYTTKLYWCQERHSEELALPSEGILAQMRQAAAFKDAFRREI